MKTLSDHPLLIGQILARVEARQAKRSWWKRLFSPKRSSQARIARLGTKELLIVRDR